MAVTLPTAADVRKAREQAAKNAAERAEAARTPLFAVLGAGDAAVTAVSKAVADARLRSRAQAQEVQARLAALPQKFTADEARKTVTELRGQAEAAYAAFAQRGEKAWGEIRKQPQVEAAIARIEAYSEQLDARVDGFVDDAHDAAERALALVTRQTRSTGEQVAQATQRAAGETAETVSEAADDVAERITEVGDEAAHATRSASRRAAGRTAPKAPTTKPVARRTTNGTAGK